MGIILVVGADASAIFYRRCPVIATQELPINEQIRDPEVRLIDENGVQLGIMDVRAAQRLADERELDLVKLSSTTPPTCKLMDYSKHRYDMMSGRRSSGRTRRSSRSRKSASPPPSTSTTWK